MHVLLLFDTQNPKTVNPEKNQEKRDNHPEKRLSQADLGDFQTVKANFVSNRRCQKN